MRVFDAHCDVLMKLYRGTATSFCDDTHLQATLQGLRNGHVKVQVFAIYVPEHVHPSLRFDVALAQVDLFYREIIGKSGLVHIRSGEDLFQLQDREIGAILALEGCDCIGDDMIRLRTLLRLGVRSVGLTWNFANLVADGVLEERGGGLTNFGKEVVRELSEACVWCDVSHLSERGFWDVMELSNYVVATHANARSLASHVRNLTDEQFRVITAKNGIVGVTFVPQFLRADEKADIYDVLRHIEHFCSLGGEYHIGIGSDFDGIERTPSGLHGSEDFVRLGNLLNQYYTSRQVDNFLYNNFANAFIPIS